MQGLSRWCVLIVASLPLALAAQSAQNAIKDPTQPLTGAALKPDDELQTWQLSAIFIRPKQNLAIINNQPVHEGDVVNGRVVRRIRANRVELSGESALTLRLYPSVASESRSEE